METKISTKGQVVLPGPIRRKLGLRTGDPLERKGGGWTHCVDATKHARPESKYCRRPITGLPVLSAGPDAQLLSSKQVYEILSDFP
jgi:AbrB family looped-hinge helix DNA binding protein